MNRTGSINKEDIVISRRDDWKIFEGRTGTILPMPWREDYDNDDFLINLLWAADKHVMTSCKLTVVKSTLYRQTGCNSLWSKEERILQGHKQRAVIYHEAMGPPLLD